MSSASLLEISNESSTVNLFKLESKVSVANTTYFVLGRLAIYPWSRFTTLWPINPNYVFVYMYLAVEAEFRFTTLWLYKS